MGHLCCVICKEDRGKRLGDWVTHFLALWDSLDGERSVPMDVPSCLWHLLRELWNRK
jgi:hypothetical protein